MNVIPALESKDVTDCIMFALSVPSHVQVCTRVFNYLNLLEGKKTLDLILILILQIDQLVVSGVPNKQ